VSTTQADNLTAALRERLRQVTAERDQLEADVQLVTAERDQLVCELDAADADLAWSSLLSAPVRQLSLDTRDR
jgi:predicted component of type VI protein secretion system